MKKSTATGTETRQQKKFRISFLQPEERNWASLHISSWQCTACVTSEEIILSLKKKANTVLTKR